MQQPEETELMHNYTRTRTRARTHTHIYTYHLIPSQN